jgi:head-tail adaptor
MSFGKMNTRVSIAEETVTKDAEGFAIKTDNVLASVRAYREGRHGSQKWVNRAAFSEATDLFRLRVIPSLTVTTAHVILCGADRFEITSVEDVKGRKMYLELLGKRVTADG